jgi:hypothetical protein
VQPRGDRCGNVIFRSSRMSQFRRSSVRHCRMCGAAGSLSLRPGGRPLVGASFRSPSPSPWTSAGMTPAEPPAHGTPQPHTSHSQNSPLAGRKRIC